MKALCVLEAILRKKEDGNLSIVYTYFSENTDVIQRCADSPQSSLREKANKVRLVLQPHMTSRVMMILLKNVFILSLLQTFTKLSFLVLCSYDGLTQNTGFV